MKFRLFHFALLLALPGIIYASSFSSIATDVRFVEASQAESLIVRQSHSYDLVWSGTVGKFETRIRENSRPLIIDQSSPFIEKVPVAPNRALSI